MNAMKSNERIFVEYYDATCNEDDYEKGESLQTTSYWSSNDLPVEKNKTGYASVAEALEAVCNTNGFTHDPKAWIDWHSEYGEEIGRFDFQTLVNEHNCEASKAEIERWKKGEGKLYTCYIVVKLSVRATRRLTEEECASFRKD